MRNLITLSAFALLAAGLIVSSGCTAAYADGPISQQQTKERSISVSGSGSVRVKPDIATAIVGASKLSPKLPDSKSACDQAIAQIKAALKKQNVADEDIQTVQYQIYRVVPNPNSPNAGTAQWKVVHMLQVRTKQPDKIAAIVDAAVASGATDVTSIDFSVDSLAKHRTKARELAIQAAKEKAAQLASLLGVGVGEVISVSEGGGNYFGAQMATNMSFDYEEGRAGMGSGIAGGQIEVKTDVSVVFGIR